MTINSTNPYQNLSSSRLVNVNNSILNSENKNLKYEENSVNRIDFEQKNITYASEFGFRIDENGNFEKDLNKISNIPDSYDINIKSVRLISKQLLKQDENLNYNKIDLPNILNKYYSSMKALNFDFAKDDNANLSRNEISNLNQGFSTKSGEFNDDIIRVYQNQEQLNNAKKQLITLNTLMLDNKIIDFGFDKAINNTSNNDIIKPYLNRNFEVSKSGLLMNFIYQDIKSNDERNANFFMNPVQLDFKAHENLYKILNNDLSLDDYVKQNNEEKMSFDLYLYVNGVDKNTTSYDKLSVFFQQYINYQKDMNLKEFANSSSIYKLYFDGISSDFNKIKENYENNFDNEQLKKVNQIRNNSVDFFLERRKKQASLNKILNSYINLMSS